MQNMQSTKKNTKKNKMTQTFIYVVRSYTDWEEIRLFSKQ